MHNGANTSPRPNGAKNGMVPKEGVTILLMHIIAFIRLLNGKTKAPKKSYSLFRYTKKEVAKIGKNWLKMTKLVRLSCCH